MLLRNLMLILICVVWVLPNFADAAEPHPHAAFQERAQEYSPQIINIENSIHSKHQATRRPQSIATEQIGWVVNDVMIVAGVALIATGTGSGIGAALIIGGVLSMVMMTPVGTNITEALTHQLEMFGIPPQDAAIAASVIMGVVIIVASMGVGSESAGEALAVAH